MKITNPLKAAYNRLRASLVATRYLTIAFPKSRAAGRLLVDTVPPTAHAQGCRQSVTLAARGEL